MVKKSQFAIEYLVVAGFAVFVMSVAVFFVYNQMSHKTSELEVAQINKFGNSIIELTNKLSYMVEQSRLTTQVVLPSNIKDIYVENKKDLVVEYQRDGEIGEIVFHSNLNLALDFDEFNPGVKNIILESKKNYVLICSQENEFSCDNVCEITSKEENTSNNHNDCCKTDCTGCREDGNFYFCESDGLCHAACDNHNDCNAQCDWDGFRLWQDFCYNCTLSCQWGNPKSCPRACLNETPLVCGDSAYNHTLGLKEYCNYGMVCNVSGCSYLSYADLNNSYCYSCTSAGATQGDYCPSSGSLTNNICYYGNRNCTGSNLLNCTLNTIDMGEGFEYYSLVDNNPSWRLDNDSNLCEWGDDPCITIGNGLTNSEPCYPAGIVDDNNICYYDPSGDTDRSNDCSITGCTLSKWLDCLGTCDSILGCI